VGIRLAYFLSASSERAMVKFSNISPNIIMNATMAAAQKVAIPLEK